MFRELYRSCGACSWNITRRPTGSVGFNLSFPSLRRKTSKSFAETPIIFEDIIKALNDTFGLKLDFYQYALVGSTVRSYLAYLSEKGRLPQFLK